MIAVYLLKGRSGSYVLRWMVPCVDAARGWRWCEESTRVRDKVTARAMRAAKLAALNGVTTEAGQGVTLSELATTDRTWLENRNRAAGTVYLSGLALRHFQGVVGDVAEQDAAQPIRRVHERDGGSARAVEALAAGQAGAVR